jgi:hypothetical protein
MYKDLPDMPQKEPEVSSHTMLFEDGYLQSLRDKKSSDKVDALFYDFKVGLKQIHVHEMEPPEPGIEVFDEGISALLVGGRLIMTPILVDKEGNRVSKKDMIAYLSRKYGDQIAAEVFNH